MSSGVRSQASTSPSGGMRRMGQGILAIDRNGGSGGVPGEGPGGVFSPLALLPRVFVINSQPCTYAFHAGTTIAAFRIWSRVRARSCGCRWGWGVCGGRCD